MTADAVPPLDAEYVLPLRWTDDQGLDDLTRYLHRLARIVPVTVVDGSPGPVFAEHHRRWSATVRHIVPEAGLGAGLGLGRNGKVAGVLTGVQQARSDRVVVADDDVRYDTAALVRLVGLLDVADVVRPQNHYDPLPWQARWDTGRTLVNRGLGADFPGTLGVRRSTLLRAGGYDGDVLFENLELIRTVRAAGGTELRADDLYVARRPPSVRHFWSQRVRQAYDSQAQPLRLAAELALLPVVACAGRRRTSIVLGLLTGAVLVAERGRRRAGGGAVFPAGSALFAPLWVAERAVCSWVAVLLRLRGGVPYAGARLRRAATPQRQLRARYAAVQGRREGGDGVPGPEHGEAGHGPSDRGTTVHGSREGDAAARGPLASRPEHVASAPSVTPSLRPAAGRAS